MNDERKSIKDIERNVESARVALDDIAKWLYSNVVGSDVLPKELPLPLATKLADLSVALDSIGRAANSVGAIFTLDPLALLHGLRLSQEQYYRYRAQGALFGTAKEVGLAKFDDYYVYQMLCYEDGESSQYINVNAKPADVTVYSNLNCSTHQKVGLRYGLAPEECKRRHLRPEQELFFRDHLPNVYARFSCD